jgi:hypothetical protein
LDEQIAFLRLCLDEDAAAARSILAQVQASPGSFVALGLEHPELAAGDCPSYLGEYDPARVLAEIEAKRRVLAWAAMRLPRASDSISAEEVIVRLFIQPYADREGWKEEWAV